MISLESGMSFLQVKSSMTGEGEAKARGATCVNRREIAHTRLEAVAGANNLYSIIAIFGRGILKSRLLSSSCLEVCSRRGDTLITKDLHGRNSTHAQPDRNLCGSYQLRGHFGRFFGAL